MKRPFLGRAATAHHTPPLDRRAGRAGSRHGAGRRRRQLPQSMEKRPLDTYVDDWGYRTRFCTSWVAWALHDRNQFEMPRAIGNAKEWGPRAQAHGYSVNMTPARGSVAWWNGGAYGHVAWVESVSGDDVVIQEYNYDNQGDYNQRTINKSQVSGYIHFDDIVDASGPGSRLMGDVNGDGKSDAVVMFRDTGTAMVALSTGDSFATPSSWHTYTQLGLTNTFLLTSTATACPI